MRTRRAQARGSRKDGIADAMRTRGQAGARFGLRRDAGCYANSAGSGARFGLRRDAGCYANSAGAGAGFA